MDKIEEIKGIDEMKEIKEVKGNISQKVYEYYESKKEEDTLTSHVITNMVVGRFTNRHGVLEDEYLLYHYGVLKTNFIMMPTFYWDLTHLDCDNPENDKEVIFEIVTFFRFIKEELNKDVDLSKWDF